MARGRKTGAPAKSKKLNYELIPESEKEPYGLMEEARRRWHPELAEGRMLLAWRRGWKRNADGLLTLGRCMKIGDLQRECVPADFVIVLNREVWMEREFTREKKLALLDHELCHAAVSLDRKTGEPRRDERGRTVFRLRKHEIEEFRGVVERHGCYKADLERFAESLLKKMEAPLLAGLKEGMEVKQ